MRILILNWRDSKNPKSGGAEVVTLEHAKAWVKAGHQVDWVSMTFKGAKLKEVFHGITFFRKGNTLTIFIHAFFHYLFSERRYDVVIDEVHGIPFFTPLYVRKPKIVFIHEVAEEIWDYMFPFPMNKIGKFLESFYFRFYPNIPVWTDAESMIPDLVKKHVKKENCIAIPCPTDTVPVTKLPVKEKVPTFIFVSRLVKMKGIEEVIRAFTEIIKKEKDAQLWIIGDGEEAYVKKLKELVKELKLENHVTFWGYVSKAKKIELMRKAHLLLHASIKEGWGLVVLEAASQTTPSVVYNVTGLRDTVKNDKTGVVISRNNPEELADEAVKLYRDKRRYEKYQKGGLAWVKSLTWEAVTKQSLGLLSSISRAS